MPRALREEVAGGVYHVFARGNRKQAIFLDDRDCASYLYRLGRTAAHYQWHCLAYCLMGNHVHLLIETRRPNLGAGIQRLHGRYAQAFNRRHEHCGHLFQGRYGATRMRDEAQLVSVVRYIALNPVKAGLSTNPEEWRWSSHRTVLGAAGPAWLDTDRLLGYLSAFGGDPLRRYADLLTDVLAAPWGD